MTLPVSDRVRIRAAAETAIRAYFAARSVLEVSVPCLVQTPAMEAHLVGIEATPRYAHIGRRFLHTSPEFAIKATFSELDADVFTLARSFRDEPLTRWHHVEFTMLEWYRRGGLDLLYCDVAALHDQVCDAVAQTLGVPSPPQCSFKTTRLADAFQSTCDVDILVADQATLLASCRDAGIDVRDEWDWDTLFTVLYAECVEPSLATQQPEFVTHFPASQAALARLDPDDSRQALRFEAYVRTTSGPVELANAFAELTDSAEQRARFEHDQHTRAQASLEVYPMPEAMLKGITQMPITSGIALGVERLLVYATERLTGEQLTVRDFLLGEPTHA
ncbi:MAG: lysyl-tRNA synthetase class 2 [Bradymonadia bacterium]|jgi:lysyl-tRNA synthetase class 2